MAVLAAGTALRWPVDTQPGVNVRVAAVPVVDSSITPAGFGIVWFAGWHDGFAGIFRIDTASGEVRHFPDLHADREVPLVAGADGLLVGSQSGSPYMLVRPDGTHGGRLFPQRPIYPVGPNRAWFIDGGLEQRDARLVDLRTSEDLAAITIEHDEWVVGVEEERILVRSRLTAGTFWRAVDGTVTRATGDAVLVFRDGAWVETSCDERLACRALYVSPIEQIFAAPGAFGLDGWYELSPTRPAVALVGTRLAVFDFTSGRTTDLGRLRGFGGSLYGTVSWTPDGESIVWVDERGVMAWTLGSVEPAVLLPSNDIEGSVAAG